jgi:hypothetical protein
MKHYPSCTRCIVVVASMLLLYVYLVLCYCCSIWEVL